jgi:hypothetical protein
MALRWVDGRGGMRRRLASLTRHAIGQPAPGSAALAARCGANAKARFSD